jgi:hypothetical protein
VFVSKLITIAIAPLLAGLCMAQAAPQQPQVTVNYLNVCTPSEAEQREMFAALGKVPLKQQFAPDFEVARGRSSMDPSSIIAGAGAQMDDGKPSTSRWVRIRREYPAASPFSNAQYSFSTSEGRVSETLVFRVRDPKDLLQISLSTSVAAPTDPAQAAGMDSPPDRIRIERFGKSSIVLARCKDADQTAYEPLFKSAAGLFSTYRKALDTAKIVPVDLAKTASVVPAPAKSASVPVKKSTTKK